ncbi:hypothetical protein Q5692_36050, partial [Microcoleus sp. C2C3]
PLLVPKTKTPLLVPKTKTPLLVPKTKTPLLVPVPGIKPSSYAGELLANPKSSFKARSAAGSLLRLRALLNEINQGGPKRRYF